MDTAMEAVARIRLLSGEVCAAKATLRLTTAKLDEDLRQVLAENEAVLRNVDALKSQIVLLDRECEMILQKIERTKQQIVMFDTIIRPQQLAELDSLKEMEEMKKEKYRLMLEKYENIWKKYEITYDRFPRVAERNALQKEVELLKIELLKKRQLVVEKAKQAEQMQVIKAQRLQIFQDQFLEEYAKEQNIRKECEKLELQNKEIKAKIMEKEALKLEEQQASQAESDSNLGEIVHAEEPAVTRYSDLIIPKFTMPVLDLDITMPSAYSQGPPVSSLVPLAPKQASSTRMSFSQPAKSSAFSCDVAAPKPAKMVSQAKPMSLRFPRRHETSVDLIKHYQNESQSEGNLVNRIDSIVPVEMESASQNSEVKYGTNLRTPEKTIVSSGINKKESILSTDNIAAKMKESSHSNPKHSLASPVKPPTKKVFQEPHVTQGCVNFAQETIEDKCSTALADPMAVDANVDLSDMLTNENEGAVAAEPAQKGANDSALEDADIFSCDSAENVNNGTEDDNRYDFNAEEYGDEYGSPPPFEAVMSPVHAHFESPPLTDMDEDTPGDGAFSRFNFFTKTTNIFGGQSKSEDTQEHKEKSTSSFPFFF